MAFDHPKPTILIVEDEEGPRNALKIILRPFFELAITSNRHEALQALLTQPVDLVTLDLKLPDGYGLDLFHAIKRARRGVEIVIITGYGTLKSSQEAVRHGAAGYLLKPFNVAELIALINHTLERKYRLDDLRSFLLSAQGLWKDARTAASVWTQLRTRFSSPVPAHATQVSSDQQAADALTLFSDLLEASDHALLSHARRVRDYASLLAAPLNLGPDDRRALTLGSFLHDIGFVAMDRWEGTEQDAGEGSGRTDNLHPALGAQMLKPLGIPESVLGIIAHHHERYDGVGHPDGLTGDQTPLLARIVAIAETFDHLTVRHGFPAMPFAEACNQLEALSGTALDPALVELFLAHVGQLHPTRAISANV